MIKEDAIFTGGTRLSSRTLGLLGNGAAAPRYDRSICQTGIIHLGPGNFHRAHQAVYADDLLNNGDMRWGICGVSLRRPDVREALADQDFLYSLAILDRETRFRVIGSLIELLSAPQQTEAVLQRLAAPQTHIVSLTITEKGYCLTPSGDLNDAHPEIVSDLARPQQPTSAVGFLVESLRRRRAAELPSFTVMSCDNLSDNGHRLGRAVRQFAQSIDVDLAGWIEQETRFPCTMVDSITPATDDCLRSRVCEAIGLYDAWPVQREAFSQWVIEDSFSAGRPEFEAVGATMTGAVAPFEAAKLRLLNGAHSSIAYLGILCGHDTVIKAVADDRLMAHIKRMMSEEIRPSLPREITDLDAYMNLILERFGNPAIQHRLSQIAWDGSQKLPFRILDTISDNLRKGVPIDRLCLTVAAWLQFVRRRVRDGIELVDPLSPELTRIANCCTGHAKNDIAQFGELDTVFTRTLYQAPPFQRVLIAAYNAIESHGVYGALSRFVPM